MHKNIGNRNMVYALYVVGFLDLFGVSLIFPLISRRIRELGASPAVVGAVVSVYGGIQLFSSPAMGKASDVVGRRKALLVSLAGSAVGYFFLGCANSLTMIVVCRVIIGIFKHSLSIIKTYVTDIGIEPSEHASVFGKLNAISNVGFIIGPSVGGMLAMRENGFFIVSLFTAILFAVNFLFVLLFLRVTPSEKQHKNSIVPTKDKKPVHNDELHSNKGGDGGESPQENGPRVRVVDKGRKNEAKSSEDEKPLKQPKKTYLFNLSISSLKEVWDILLIRFVFGFGMMLYRGSFSSLLEFRYHSTPQVSGYILSFNGIVGVIFGLLSGRVISLFKSDAATMYYISTILVLSLAGLTYAPTLWTVLFFQIPLSLASSTMRVCATSITFQRGREDEKGVLMGLGNSLLSLARMLSPALAGLALEYSIYGPGCLSVIVSTLGFMLMNVFPQERNSFISRKEKVL